MPNHDRHTQPLDVLREHAADVLDELKSTGGPLIFTVDGKPEAVLQGAAEYQRLRDLASFADEDEAIRQGDEDIRAGRTRPAEEVFEEMRRVYGIPR